jgi:hypothetical protein
MENLKVGLNLNMIKFIYLICFFLLSFQIYAKNCNIFALEVDSKDFNEISLFKSKGIDRKNINNYKIYLKNGINKENVDLDSFKKNLSVFINRNTEINVNSKDLEKILSQLDSEKIIYLIEALKEDNFNKKTKIFFEKTNIYMREKDIYNNILMFAMGEDLMHKSYPFPYWELINYSTKRNEFLELPPRWLELDGITYNYKNLTDGFYDHYMYESWKKNYATKGVYYKGAWKNDLKWLYLMIKEKRLSKKIENKIEEIINKCNE